MTSQDQPDWPTQDPLQETHRLGDQRPSPRRKGRALRAHRNSRRIGIGLSVAVIGGVIAAVVSIATGTHTTASSGSSAAGGTGGTAVPGGGGTAPGGGTSTAKGGVISAAKLAEEGGALSPPKNMQDSITSWQSGAGGRELTAVSSQLGYALQASGLKQYSSAKYACIRLSSNVVTAQSGPAIPVTAMQALYTKALAELAKGAADCRTAISSKSSGVDTAMLHQALSDFSAGASDIFRATAEIQILNRQHH